MASGTGLGGETGGVGEGNAASRALGESARELGKPARELCVPERTLVPLPSMSFRARPAPSTISTSGW
ncbi:hypothetical protein ABZX51_003979 [Aspergillus tubingensis]